MGIEGDSLSGVLATPARRKQLIRWLVSAAIVGPVVAIFIKGGVRGISIIQLVGAGLGGAFLMFAVWLRRQMADSEAAERQAQRERDELDHDPGASESAE